MKLENPYVSRIVLVVNTNIEKRIRYMSEDIENHFSKIVKSQAIATNVPDSSPPDVPRFQLRDKDKVISISQNTLQFELDYFSQKKSFEQLSVHFNKILSEFYNKCLDFKKNGKIKFFGLIVIFNRKSKLDKYEGNASCYKKLFNVKEMGNVENFNFSSGFFDKDKKIFINIGLNIYEIRKGDFQIGDLTFESKFIEIESFPVEERGIEIKIDVNNKPSVGGSNVDSFNVLYGELVNACEFYKELILK